MVKKNSTITHTEISVGLLWRRNDNGFGHSTLIENVFFFSRYELFFRFTHVRVSSTVDPGADEGDELVAFLVNHKPADLTLVALLADIPKKLLILFSRN